MRILAIESSCDETAAAVVQDGRVVLSSVIASQIAEHQLYGGVVPEIASRRHSEAIAGITEQALAQAGTSLRELDAIAVTCAPGLIGALLVGVNFAKGLALCTGLPLVPVHHLRGHIAANYLTDPTLEPPFLCLIVSGGHTHLIDVRGYTDLQVVGQTRDDAAGEAFDKVARAMGMPYPGGVHLDVLAETGDRRAFALPHPKVEGHPLDFSFSGLKTAVLNLLNNAAQKGQDLPTADLAASFRGAVVDCLLEKTVRAMEHTGHRTLVTAGGVSANRLLRRALEELCRERGWKLHMPALEWCGDNAAMIGAQAYYEYLNGQLAGMDLNACAAMPIAQNF